jgi:16S rRNA G966 N2-methylase RsmD
MLTTLAKVARSDLDIVFLDPPYEAAEEYSTTLRFLSAHHVALLALGALVIAEHPRKQPPASAFGSLERTRVLEQGDGALSFYEIRTPIDPGSEVTP